METIEDYAISVCFEIEELEEMSTSDAQGIMMSPRAERMLKTCYEKGVHEKEAAQEIIEITTVKL